MDKFMALSLVLLGIVIGLGYAVACGSGDDDKSTVGPMLPGVGVAMAQSGRGAWEVMRWDTQLGEFGMPAQLPPGWSPLSNDSGALLWVARCAQ
jgi:hypothetical protein